MRSFALLSIALLSFACSSTKAPTDKATVDAGPPPAAVPDPSSPLEQTIALYEHAWDALLSGDEQGARRLAQEAIEALDPETPANTNWGRVQLLRHLAVFCNNELGMRRLGMSTWKRMSRAFDLWEAGEWETRVASAGVARAGAPPALPPAISEMGPLERPTNTDIFRVDDPSSLGGESEREPGAKTAGTKVDEGPGRPDPAAHLPGALSAGSERHAAEPLFLEKQVLLAKVLLALGRAAEARALLDDVLARLGETSMDSPGAASVRELIAAASESGSQRERAAPRDAAADPVPPDDAAGTGAEKPGPRGRTPGEFGIGDPDSLRALLNALAASSSAGPSAGRAAQVELGDIAYGAGEFDLARGFYTDSLAQGAADDRTDPWWRASMGLARVADASGSGADLSLLQRLADEARRKHSPGHPLVLETRERLARAVHDAQGSEAYRGLLESFLADQQRALGEDHPAIQATRRALAVAYAEQGDPLRALDFQRSAFQSWRRTAPEVHPIVAEARLELVGMLAGLGEHRAALELLDGSPLLVDPQPTDASAELDSLEEMSAAALELQLTCKLPEALDLRRRIVERQRATLKPDDPERAEGLQELAALLRVLGRPDEARDIEAEAHVVGRTTADERERLAAWMADARARLARASSPPRVVLSAADVDVGGLRKVTAEIEDVAGILALYLLQDGIPRSLSLDDTEWSLDPTGTRGRLELLVSTPEDQGLTVVSLASENLRHVKSEYASVVLPRE